MEGKYRIIYENGQYYPQSYEEVCFFNAWQNISKPINFGAHPNGSLAYAQELIDEYHQQRITEKQKRIIIEYSPKNPEKPHNSPKQPTT